MKKNLLFILFLFAVSLIGSLDGIGSINVEASSISEFQLFDDPTIIKDCSFDYIGVCTVPGGDLPTQTPTTPRGGNADDFSIKSFMYIPD